MPIDEEEIVARELCEAAGEKPDRRIQDYGRSSFSYPAWELYREEARHLIRAQKEEAMTARKPRENLQ